MAREYPQFRVVRITDSEAKFVGTLLVRPDFPVYTVSILYREHLNPRVKVIAPSLVNNPPHFYENTGTLCLYHPSNFHWSAGRLVAREIVQWTAAWIYFYEVWLRTGVWYGPEAQHGETEKKN